MCVAGADEQPVDARHRSDGFDVVEPGLALDLPNDADLLMRAGVIIADAPEA